MKAAELKVISFGAQDVIATSGVYTFTNLGNNEKNDAKFLDPNGNDIFDSLTLGGEYGTTLFKLSADVSGTSGSSIYECEDCDANGIWVNTFSPYNGEYKFVDGYFLHQ